jgi:hypothetical protein
MLFDLITIQDSTARVGQLFAGLASYFHGLTLLESYGAAGLVGFLLCALGFCDSLLGLRKVEKGAQHRL